MNRFVRKLRKNSLRKSKTIFGVSLVENSQHFGQPLPLPLQFALQYLRRSSLSQQGIFRKPGVKTRITKLRQAMDASPDEIDFSLEEFSPYDIADVVKQYFKDLPEPLMTNKLSSTFTSIFIGKHLKIHNSQAPVTLVCVRLLNSQNAFKKLEGFDIFYIIYLVIFWVFSKIRSLEWN